MLKKLFKKLKLPKLEFNVYDFCMTIIRLKELRTKKEVEFYAFAGQLLNFQRRTLDWFNKNTSMKQKTKF